MSSRGIDAYLATEILTDADADADSLTDKHERDAFIATSRQKTNEMGSAREMTGIT